MKWRFTPNDWVRSGVALVALYALQKLFWVLLPTGLLNAYSSADGWQFPPVSKNLASWRALATDILNVPAWYFEYGYFYAIISSVAWLSIAVLLALRKAYALRVLLLFSAFSIIHGVAISVVAFYDGPARDIPLPWKAAAFYVLLAIIFTRPVVRAQYVQQRDA
jgi:predicted neutral ceramidase superfamily lipid hydrolase